MIRIHYKVLVDMHYSLIYRSTFSNQDDIRIDVIRLLDKMSIFYYSHAFLSLKQLTKKIPNFCCVSEREIGYRKPSFISVSIISSHLNLRSLCESDEKSVHETC